MQHKAQIFISPTFTHEKLDSPSYHDIVDVFEDRMVNWLIEPACKLLCIKHGFIAAVAIVMNYFEGIEIYYSGEDSKGRSQEFFCRGFKRVFQSFSAPQSLLDKIVDALYFQARCGFAHDSLFRNRVYFSTDNPQALFVTWPKKDGEFVKDEKFESVIINPICFCEGVRMHFNKYVKALRDDGEPKLKANFLAAVELKWALNEHSPFVGMPII